MVGGWERGRGGVAGGEEGKEGGWVGAEIGDNGKVRCDGAMMRGVVSAKGRVCLALITVTKTGLRYGAGGGILRGPTADEDDVEREQGLTIY